jgi:hypothetical protein
LGEMPETTVALLDEPGEDHVHDHL